MSASSTQSGLYQPSYITDQQPNFYGGQQKDYIELAECAIASGVKTIADGIKKRIDSAEIYQKLIDDYQKARHEIALKHQPEKAHFFGIRRDALDKKNPFITTYTGLYHPYAKYNQKFIQQLIKVLHQIPHDLKTFSKTSTTLKETVLGKKYSFEVQLLEGHALRDLFTPPSQEELYKALAIKVEHTQTIFENYEITKRLKNDHKKLYDRLTLFYLINDLNNKFPPESARGQINEDAVIRYEKKNIYVWATVRLELEPNKMYCIARHLTWMYQTYSDDPINRMKEHSVDFVVHQDPFLLERTQQACAKIFTDALAWSNEDSLEKLKDQVALLRFVYGNSMPCCRGDGAIGDWLELAIYRHHGFTQTRHNNKVLPCFELLSCTSLTEYLKEYRNTIIVE